MSVAILVVLFIIELIIATEMKYSSAMYRPGLAEIAHKITTPAYQLGVAYVTVCVLFAPVTAFDLTGAIIFTAANCLIAFIAAPELPEKVLL